MLTIRRRAVQCALEMMTDLTESLKRRTDEGRGLTLHIGLGIGVTTMFLVGGFRSRYEFLIAGESMSQAAVAEEGSAPNEVCVSLKLWEGLEKYFSGTPRTVHGSDVVHVNR
jgi:class 3 adenylate cyclase